MFPKEPPGLVFNVFGAFDLGGIGDGVKEARLKGFGKSQIVSTFSNSFANGERLPLQVNQIFYHPRL